MGSVSKGMSLTLLIAGILTVVTTICATCNQEPVLPIAGILWLIQFGTRKSSILLPAAILPPADSRHLLGCYHRGELNPAYSRYLSGRYNPILIPTLLVFLHKAGIYQVVTTSSQSRDSARFLLIAGICQVNTTWSLFSLSQRSCI